MYPHPSNTIPSRRSSALAANPLPPDVPPESRSRTVASALQGARMTYRELAPDLQLKVARYAHTARDVEILRDADLFNAEQWRPTLAQAKLVDQIDQFSNGPARMNVMNALIDNIQRAQPDPSPSRDAVLAHFIKKTIDSLADRETFQLTRWNHRFVERDGALFASRIHLGGIHRKVLPLATEKAQDWFKEVALCAQLRLEMMAFHSPVSPERIRSIIAHAKNDISSTQWKSALLSDVVGALRESMNSNETYNTKDIFLDILSLSRDLPAKHRATIMKELIHDRQVLPNAGRSDILEELMAMSTSLPLECQLSKVPLKGQVLPASAKTSTAVRVVEFAQCVSPEKWRASLDRLIEVVPSHTKDRALALARLAATCVDYAAAAKQNGGNAELHPTDYLDEFKKIMTAISTTVPPHHRFIALVSMPARAMPTPAHDNALQACVKTAMRATARGAPEHMEIALMTFWNVLSASAARR